MDVVKNLFKRTILKYSGQSNSQKVDYDLEGHPEVLGHQLRHGVDLLWLL